MAKYLATFPAGCYPIIEKRLKNFGIKELKIAEHDESSAIFESRLTAERLIELRFFTNVYAFAENTLELNGGYFSLAMLKNGEPAAISKTERDKLEVEINKKYGLKTNTHLAKNNFYLIRRASGREFLAVRLSRAKFKREKLQAGELRPELSHILCLMAGIKANDVVLDPFAGYGSIPLEAVRGFGCKKVIAVDTQVLAGRHKNNQIEWHQASASNLDFISDGSINRVITDPPWGIYEGLAGKDLPQIYELSLNEIRRVLKEGGVAEILSGSVLLDEAIKNADGLKKIKEYSILVSGKKARIHRLQKA